MEFEEHPFGQPPPRTSLEHLRLNKVESSDEDSEEDEEAFEIKYGGPAHTQFGSLANQEIPDVEILEEVKTRPFSHSRQPSRAGEYGLTEI